MPAIALLSRRLTPWKKCRIEKTKQDCNIDDTSCNSSNVLLDFCEAIDFKNLDWPGPGNCRNGINNGFPDPYFPLRSNIGRKLNR